MRSSSAPCLHPGMGCVHTLLRPVNQADPTAWQVALCYVTRGGDRAPEGACSPVSTRSSPAPKAAALLGHLTGVNSFKRCLRTTQGIRSVGVARESVSMARESVGMARKSVKAWQEKAWAWQEYTAASLSPQALPQLCVPCHGKRKQQPSWVHLTCKPSKIVPSPPTYRITSTCGTTQAMAHRQGLSVTIRSQHGMFKGTHRKGGSVCECLGTHTTTARL